MVPQSPVIRDPNRYLCGRLPGAFPGSRDSASVGAPTKQVNKTIRFSMGPSIPV